MTLHNKISEFENANKINLIYFNGFFNQFSVAYLENRIDELLKNKSNPDFLILLKSRGGHNVYGVQYLTVLERIRSIPNIGKFMVLVNGNIASTATQVSFCSDKLFYSEIDALIGPIDPQANNSSTIIPMKTSFSINWESKKIENEQDLKIENLTEEEKEKAIKTINAAVRDFANSNILQEIEEKEFAFNYLMNTQNNFCDGHSTRVKISNLPDKIKDKLQHIDTLQKSELLKEILTEFNTIWFNNNFFIY